MHQQVKVMRADSKEPELLKQLIYKLQQSFRISGENVFSETQTRFTDEFNLKAAYFFCD